MGKNIKRKNSTTNALITPDLPDRKGFLWVAAILTITFIVFIPALKNQFITFDDHQYVVENPFIKGFSADNLKAIFTSDANDLGNYHPLTLLSFVVNYSFSGLDPAPYHLTNVLLHLLNTFLVFQLAWLLFERTVTDHKLILSLMVALLFGIHPLHVESVAWVSGRKDLLYTCFYLLSLILYLRYVAKGSVWKYALSLVCFLFSLASKGMAVTLSLTLVVIDYLLKRDLLSRKVILEKIPYFAMSLVFGIIAIVVQQAQGATDIIRFSFGERIIFASFGFTQYLVKTIVPYSLCGYYPYPDLEVAMIPAAYYLTLIPAVLSLGLLVYFLLLRPDRKIVFGILFFIVNVMFVLQLFPVGSAVMADRYTYLSSFGLFFLIALGGGYLITKFRPFKKYLLTIFIFFAGILSVFSGQRCAIWRESYTFWNDIADKYPHFFPAMNNLGEFYEKDGRTKDAFDMFSRSIKAHEDNPNAYFHRGSLYGKSGQAREAIADFNQAIRYSPRFTQAYVNRAIAKAMIQDYHGALSDLDTVLSRDRNEGAYFNRGILRNQLKDYKNAIPDFREAVKMNPRCTKCYYSMGLANYSAGMYAEAITSFTECISLDPSIGNAYYYRALSSISIGKADSSCTDLHRAVSLGIKDAEPVLNQYCGPN